MTNIIVQIPATEVNEKGLPSALAPDAPDTPKLNTPDVDTLMLNPALAALVTA